MSAALALIAGGVFLAFVPAFRLCPGVRWAGYGLMALGVVGAAVEWLD